MKLNTFFAIPLFIGICCHFVEVWTWESCNPELEAVPPMANLSLELLTFKLWYVHQVFVTRAEDVTPPVVNCYAQQYRLWSFMGQLSPGIEDIYTGIASGIKAYNGSFVLEVEGRPAAVWTVADVNHDEISFHKTIYTNTDYVNYGLMHWCPGTSQLGEIERLMVFTGSPIRNETLLGELQEMVAAFGFPTEHVIDFEHHPHCDYEEY